MLVVPTLVAASGIHGIGVFSKSFIDRGDLIWKFDSRVDRVILLEETFFLPPVVRDFIDIYAQFYERRGILVLSGDNDRFMNHSDDPNTTPAGDDDPTASVVAARPIAAGEELTCDYRVIRMRRFG